MKVALIGATGFVGSRILSEALSRGHEVTAIVRNPEKLPQHPRLKAAKCDVSDEETIAVIVAGHDAVISAFNPSRVSRDNNTPQIGGIRSLIAGMKKAGVKRLLVVGGAGSLEVAPGSSWWILRIFHPFGKRAPWRPGKCSISCAVSKSWSGAF